MEALLSVNYVETSKLQFVVAIFQSSNSHILLNSYSPLMSSKKHQTCFSMVTVLVLNCWFYVTSTDTFLLISSKVQLSQNFHTYLSHEAQMKQPSVWTSVIHFLALFSVLYNKSHKDRKQLETFVLFFLHFHSKIFNITLIHNLF